MTRSSPPVGGVCWTSGSDDIELHPATKDEKPSASHPGEEKDDGGKTPRPEEASAFPAASRKGMAEEEEEEEKGVGAARRRGGAESAWEKQRGVLGGESWRHCEDIRRRHMTRARKHTHTQIQCAYARVGTEREK